MKKIEKLTGPLPLDLKQYLMNDSEKNNEYNGFMFRHEGKIHIIISAIPINQIIKNDTKNDIPLFHCTNGESILYSINNKKYLIHGKTDVVIGDTFESIKEKFTRPESDDAEYIESVFDGKLSPEFIKVFKSKKYQYLASAGLFELGYDAKHGEYDDMYTSEYLIGNSEMILRWMLDLDNDDDELQRTHNGIPFGIYQEDYEILFINNKVYINDVYDDIDESKVVSSSFEHFINDLYNKYNEARRKE